nr:translation initiation factor IF-2 [Oryctolagus cuniculus]
MSRQLGQKWNSWDLNQHPFGMPAPGREAAKSSCRETRAARLSPRESGRLSRDCRLGREIVASPAQAKARCPQSRGAAGATPRRGDEAAVTPQTHHSDSPHRVFARTKPGTNAAARATPGSAAPPPAPAHEGRTRHREPRASVGSRTPGGRSVLSVSTDRFSPGHAPARWVAKGARESEPDAPHSGRRRTPGPAQGPGEGSVQSRGQSESEFLIADPARSRDRGAGRPSAGPCAPARGGAARFRGKGPRPRPARAARRAPPTHASQPRPPGARARASAGPLPRLGLRLQGSRRPPPRPESTSRRRLPPAGAPVPLPATPAAARPGPTGARLPSTHRRAASGPAGPRRTAGAGTAGHARGRASSTLGGALPHRRGPQDTRTRRRGPRAGPAPRRTRAREREESLE